MGQYRWHSGTTQILPRGYTPEDIVHQVITKTWDGRRNWDPAKGELLPWLRDQARSEVDALARSAPHHREMALSEGEGDERARVEVEQQAVEEGILGRTLPQDAEAILLEQEAADQASEKVDAVFQAVSGEPELEEVLELVMDGCEPKPRYIAEGLDISIRDANNRLRRLRRRASAIRSPDE